MTEKQELQSENTVETRKARWDEVVASETGRIFLDEWSDGVRFIILRGPASLCAYIGAPLAHPLAGKSYGDLPLDCHGGLTFGQEGKGGKFLPEGFWWYGWDYGHCDDRSTYQDDARLGFGSLRDGGKKWTPEMVKEDSWSALYEFKKLMKLAEDISRNSAIAPSVPDASESATASSKQ